MPEVITVGMTVPARSRASFIEGVYGSNYGPELDVFAPGSGIISASYTSNDGFLTETGTSMASPLVAGLICYLRSVEGGLNSPEDVRARLIELSQKDVVIDPKGSPNVLVYNGSGS
jgi:oryzin